MSGTGIPSPIYRYICVASTAHNDAGFATPEVALVCGFFSARVWLCEDLWLIDWHRLLPEQAGSHRTNRCCIAHSAQCPRPLLCFRQWLIVALVPLPYCSNTTRRWVHTAYSPFMWTDYRDPFEIGLTRVRVTRRWVYTPVFSFTWTDFLRVVVCGVVLVVSCVVLLWCSCRVVCCVVRVVCLFVCFVSLYVNGLPRPLRDAVAGLAQGLTVYCYSTFGSHALFFVQPRSLSTAMPRTRTAVRGAIINRAPHALSPSGAAWLAHYP